MSNGDKLGAEELAIVQRNCARFRAELGEHVTQQDVADLAGISVFSVSRYESGQGPPDLKALLALSKVFGRTVEDFYNPNPPAPDPSKRRRFAVRFKVVGTPPAGMQADIDRLMRKYTPEFVDHVDAIKKAGRKRKKK